MKVSELNIPFPKQYEIGNFLLPAGPRIPESEETTLRIAGEVERLTGLLKKLIVTRTSINSF